MTDVCLNITWTGIILQYNVHSISVIIESLSVVIKYIIFNNNTETFKGGSLASPHKLSPADA